MTKLQLLHRALNERLMAAVEQIMEMVGGTVLEYEEETIRARKENEVLRRRLRWMEGANPADWPGPSEPITLSTPDESNPSRQDESAVNSGLGQESETLVIKTETTDHPLCGGTTLPQSVDQGSDVAGTSTGIAYGFAGGMTWDSAQSYMAPLDFDPTSGNSRVRHWRGRNRRQRMSFACPDCGKVFGREQRLMIHMRIHSTERPYKYRRRKAFFYGDNKKKRKLHGLSQLSREIVDDLSDCSEQTNRSSASPERLAITSRDQEEEPGGLSTESDHTSSEKEPENRTTTHQHKKKKGEKTMPCHCPHCPDREFARPCQLAMHMKTHTALVNLPSQAQSGTDEIMDAKLKSHKKQRKNAAEKTVKVAGKREFRCRKCDRVFAYKGRLRFHMKSHKTEKALLCKSLKMAVQTEPRKEETMEVVPETTEVQNLQELKKTYACPHCDKVFIREGWLEPHIRTQHRKVRNCRTRSQLPYSQQLRKRRIEKQRVTEESKQKNEESTKVRDKPSQSRDESNLVVAGYTQQLRKRSTEKQGVAEESKQKNEESKKVNDTPSTSTDESNLVADVPKITTDEAEQSADLPKRGPDESKCTPEQSKEDTSDSDRETSFTTKMKRMFPCKVCGKEFVREKKLKKHSRKHIGRRLQDEKKRKREQALREDEILEQAGMIREEKDDNDKTSTSNHNLNTTPQGSPNKELLRKAKTRGQGPLPCPFCGKVFAWEMRLMMHMQIHCGEKPYSYRQRQTRFYGDLKRGQLQKIHNQEPPGNNSDKSEESVGEEMVNEDGSAHLSSDTTHAASGALASSSKATVLEDYTGGLGLLPQTVIEQPTTCNKSNQRTKPELFSDALSHFSLQPRIVLEPITSECKYWSSVSGGLKSGRSKRSGFDHKQTSRSVLADAVEDEIVGSNLCIMPVESSGDGIQNKSEICHSVVPETEIVSVEVGSPQCYSQSEVELDKFGGPPADESSELNNTESQQKEDHDCYFLGVSEKTAIDQLPLILIDDELEQLNARTAAEHSPSECGRTKCDSKCDCNSISAMKLTVMPQTSGLESLFKETSSGSMQKKIDSELVCVVLSDVEDNVDEDVLKPKKTASVPRIQTEQLDVRNKPGENPSSDSNFSAPDATESIIKTDESTCIHAKSVDYASKHTDVEVVTSERNDQSISNDPLTTDQIASITINKTDDNPMSSMEEMSCQTSDMVFVNQASQTEVNADMKPLDMEIVNDDERKNMNLGVNNQMSESGLDDSTDNSEISGKNEPSVQNVKTNALLVKSSEEFGVLSNSSTTCQTSDSSGKTAQKK
ncbi:uncharacterized protein zgc:66474 isoform X2 [Megalobrama amblycephala]|uniref:uncharacterized protein zgc:66474 isoform X2 n=1 Tax=Megalobrama amblycephala TaxID=75352 RepID=UPI002013FC5E|nr:uncharacterized protein zgc:66474 isoform X2 [Megalobrama amblycephala]